MMDSPMIEQTYPNMRRPDWTRNQIVQVDGATFKVVDWVTERSPEGNTTYYLKREGEKAGRPKKGEAE